MLDNIFTSSPTTWFALVGAMIAIPILIHLINRFRHQRIEWAAMEFLLKSHKKNRNWIWLKQLLLLLSRIAAMLLLLFLLAQIGCQGDRISRLLGGSTTHHYILLDDSYSMSDRASDGTSFDRARSTLSLIADRTSQHQNQMVTLLRYSASRSNGEIMADNVDVIDPTGDPSANPAFNQIADLNAVPVDRLFDQRLEQVAGRLNVSPLASKLENTLRSVSELIKSRKNEKAIVYVVSDFRKLEWENPENVRPDLTAIYQTGAAIELIRCATAEQNNLAITSLEPAGNVRVAGTPLMMKVTVKNTSTIAAEKIRLKISSETFSESPGGNRSSGTNSTDELPTIFLASIAPGEAETRQFPIYFPIPGQHVVFADLEDDAISVDNHRGCVVNIRSAARVLLIENLPRKHSPFVSLALNPSRLTGVQPELKTKEFLRDANWEQLKEFDVIFLLDIDTLDKSASEKLESFVRTGGGLGVYVGPSVNFDYYRNLFRNGSGLLPMPLHRPFMVPEILEEKVADISPTTDPIFAPVLNVKNSLLDLVQIKQIIIPPLEWLAKDLPGVRVLATIRGESHWPLMIEKQLGAGRVVLITTTAGPVWNNWARNATFPPILLLLEDHLAAGNFPNEDHYAGSPLYFDMAADDYLPVAQWSLQAERQNNESLDNLISGELKLIPSSQNPSRLTGKIGRYFPELIAGETDEPGVYEVDFRSINSRIDRRRFSLNVDTTESDLALVGPHHLLEKLEECHPTLIDWDQFNLDWKQKPGSSIRRLLLLILMLVMISEQWLAYATSYHRE